MIKNIIKILFSFSVLVWLIQSGEINFSLIISLLKNPIEVIISFIGLIFVLWISTYRFKLILETRSKTSLPMKPVLKGNWIGFFFNAILPGNVTGDFIKIFYLKNLHNDFSKRFLITSSLLDRVVGLFGIIFLLGINSLFFYQSLINKSPDIKRLLDFNLALAIIIIIGLLSLYLIPSFIKVIFSALPFRKMTVHLWDFMVQIKNKVILFILISIIAQFINVFIFWFLTHNYAIGDFTLSKAFSFIPLGFIGLAIPISPSGLGVGHVLFEELFNFYSINNGASLFNLYFLVLLCCNLLGIIPYITYKSENESQIPIE